MAIKVVLTEPGVGVAHPSVGETPAGAPAPNANPVPIAPSTARSAIPVTKLVIVIIADVPPTLVAVKSAAPLRAAIIATAAVATAIAVSPVTIVTIAPVRP